MTAAFWRKPALLLTLALMLVVAAAGGYPAALTAAAEPPAATVSGNIVDVVQGTTYPGTLVLRDGRIADIRPDNRVYDRYIVPGLVDAHVHIESSMLPPSEFARLALTHGTVATVSDPHEIANVLGVAGIRYMIDDGKKAPLRFSFGASSCVPAAGFETAGAKLGALEVYGLLRDSQVKFLSEMMSYPGVLSGDAEVMEKIAAARGPGKPVDGHAPGLRGADLAKYVGAGISTDHESFALDEAIEKADLGMKVIIREGPAARNFDALHPIISRGLFDGTTFQFFDPSGE